MHTSYYLLLGDGRKVGLLGRAWYLDKHRGHTGVVKYTDDIDQAMEFTSIEDAHEAFRVVKEILDGLTLESSPMRTVTAAEAVEILVGVQLSGSNGKGYLTNYGS